MDDPKGLSLIFRALYSRNYRLFFGGQGISLIGTWMQQIAMSWLVYRLTNSVFLLGLIGFSSQISSLFFSPFAGVLSDRWNRHRIMVVTQSLAMIQALILAFLTLMGVVAVHHLIILSIFLGLVNAFDMPTRQAFVVEMVEKREDLGNAIALNSFLFNGARLVGPSIAGILISILGEGMCFLLNSVSFLAVIIALLAMKMTPNKKVSEKTQVLQGLKEGFIYAFGFPPIRSILFFLGWISLVGTANTTLMPVFARDILHGDSKTYGFLMAAIGVGAIIGAIFLASRKNVLGLGRIITIASSIFGIGLILFSLSHVLWLSLFLLLLTGFGMMVHMASSNTILQTIVDDDKRGRVMSLYAMAFMGMAPLGSLVGGSLAGWIGAPTTLILVGTSCMIGSLLFRKILPSLRIMIRPIYVRKGILSEKSETKTPTNN
ncbi:MAG: MFS transporter [Deltaproteobacteria bacterium RBG_16_48_10]|nr:MAG: MFS transporter [Deltaproteobacteria bacterium RBG_16_48_10]